MTETGKKRLLILVGFAALAIALVASSLSRMELKPGLPLPSLEGGELAASPVGEIPPVQANEKDPAPSCPFAPGDHPPAGGPLQPG